jgi:hypothetical protein
MFPFYTFFVQCTRNERIKGTSCASAHLIFETTRRFRFIFYIGVPTVQYTACFNQGSATFTLQRAALAIHILSGAAEKSYNTVDSI